MPECWAAALGGCSDKASREHLVSDALWLGNHITVRGFSWCKDKPVKVGRNAVTSKILCTHHNSQLSPVDAEAQKAFDAARQCTLLQNERQQQPDRSWPFIRFAIDGVLLERWFLKTTINLASVKEESSVTWIGTAATVSNPPLELVNAAFGRSRLTEPKGLYAAATIGQPEYSQDEVSFAPLLKGRSIAGGIFNFRGQRFLLFLGNEQLPSPFDLPDTRIPQWKSSVIRYHLKRLQWTHGAKILHCIDYHWARITRAQRAVARRPTST